MCSRPFQVTKLIGKESINHSIFEVTAPIVAYNAFMNGVDQLDQCRSTNATQLGRKVAGDNLHSVLRPCGLPSFRCLQCSIRKRYSSHKMEGRLAMKDLFLTCPAFMLQEREGSVVMDCLS